MITLCVFVFRVKWNIIGEFINIFLYCATLAVIFRVKSHGNKLTIDDEEYFDNLDELIEHYKNDADGLCTKLVNALPKESDTSKTLVKSSSKESDDLCVIPEHDLVVSNFYYSISTCYLFVYAIGCVS